MGVSRERIIHYYLTKENTDSNIFIDFMKDLNKKLTDDERKNSIIIMDNLASHLTKELFEFYYANKLKVLFNVLYLSKFNMIEMCFRAIKNKTYKTIYKNITELKNELKILIEGDYLENLLNKLFIETLNNYLNYISENIKLNLN